MRRGVIILSAALLTAMLIMKNRTGQGVPPDHAVFSTLSGSSIFVKVSGEVRHPGMYVVPDKSPVERAVIEAGILQSRVKPVTPLSAAKPLTNGSAVVVSTGPDGSPLMSIERMTVQECIVLGIPLDITAMDEDDFAHVPGIGPALAGRIASFRESHGGKLSLADLPDVEGIGEKKYARIMPYFARRDNLR